MTPAEHIAYLGGLRLEVTVCTDRVIDGRCLCSKLDHLHVSRVERATGGYFEGGSLPFDIIISEFRSRFDDFSQRLHRSYHSSPSEEVQHSLTAVRHAIGWSGKNMDGQLREFRLYTARVSAHQAAVAQQVAGEDPRFIYEGCELDDLETRRLIVDFRDNALWCLHGGFRDRTLEPLMLRRVHGGHFFPMVGRYHDRISGARYFIRQYGARWRDYIVAVERQEPRAPDVGGDVPSEIIDISSD